MALSEIARLREVNFRLTGEGTGRAEDRDDFDLHYLHLFLWDRERQQIAGAYRLCSTEVGVKGLYTATLFRYDESFLQTFDGNAYRFANRAKGTENWRMSNCKQSVAS